MKMICSIGLILGSSLLLGCNSQIDAVNQEMAQIRSQAPQQIEPAPTFNAVPSFEYAAQSLRSPFVASSVANELKANNTKSVQPNLHRQKYPLERYALEELYMKGSLGSTAHPIGLLQTPDGHLERVKVGDYLGQHQGRIVSISPLKIDLIELMEDGRGGFIQRPRSLLLIQAIPATQDAAAPPVSTAEQSAAAQTQTELPEKAE